MFEVTVNWLDNVPAKNWRENHCILQVSADGYGTTLLPRVCWLLVGDGLGSIYSYIRGRRPGTWHLVNAATVAATLCGCSLLLLRLQCFCSSNDV